MDHPPHSGGSVLFDLASLRAEHRATTRRQVIKTIYKRSSWTSRIGLVTIAALTATNFLLFLFIFFGSGGKSTFSAAGIGALLAILAITVELSASAAFKDILPAGLQKNGFVDLRLRTLRYLLFREHAQKNGLVSSDRIAALFEIDREERNLDRFAIERHPIYLLIAFGCLTLISTATSHFPIWTNAVGPTLAWIFGVLFVVWMFLRKPIAALFLTPGYRSREFGLFLKMLEFDNKHPGKASSPYPCLRKG